MINSVILTLTPLVLAVYKQVLDNALVGKPLMSAYLNIEMQKP